MIKILIQSSMLLFFQMATCHKFIDPHDMGFDDYNHKMLARNPQQDLYKSCEIQSFKENSLNHEVYLKRIVGLLINSAKLDLTPPIYIGEIKISLTSEDYNFLEEFTRAENIDENLLRRMDSTLSEALKRSFNDHFNESVNSVLDRIYNLFDYESFYQVIFIIIFLGYLYMMFKRKLSFWYIFKYIMLLFWLGDCYIKYIHMKEDFKQHNVKVMVSGDECDLSGLWNNVRYLFGNVNCDRKILSPFSVLEEQFRHIVGPLQYLGTGLGIFGYKMFVNLPWGLNLVLFPLMLVFVGLLSCIGLSFLVAVPFRVNVLHLVNLEFGYTSKHLKGNMLSEKTFNRVLDAVSQRPNIAQGTSITDTHCHVQEVQPQSSTKESSCLNCQNKTCLDKKYDNQSEEFSDNGQNNTSFLERIEEILETTNVEKNDSNIEPNTEKDLKKHEHISEHKSSKGEVPHIVKESGDTLT